MLDCDFVCLPSQSPWKPRITDSVGKIARRVGVAGPRVGGWGFGAGVLVPPRL